MMSRGSRDLTGPARQALAQASACALAVFEAAGFAHLEPGHLLAAENLLDLYGEDVRSRAFVFEGMDGEDLCLRPDLTLAICRYHLVEAGGGSAQYAAAGPVFRRPAAGESRPAQFEQVGCEWFGAPDAPVAEALTMRLCRDALGAIGLHSYKAETGDLGVLFSLLDAITMPERWRSRLKRHVWRPERFHTLLRELSRPQESDEGRIAFLRGIGALAPDQARAAVERMLTLSETTHVGIRDFGEISARFLEQAEDARAHPLSDEVVQVIEATSALKTGCIAALAALREIAGGAGVDIGAALDHFERRLDALEREGMPVGTLRFNAEFGRNLEYYDGFVFEFYDREIEQASGRRAAQLAGGGRYARMIPAAARAFDVAPGASPTAFGAAIRPETVLLAMQGPTA